MVVVTFKTEQDAFQVLDLNGPVCLNLIKPPCGIPAGYCHGFGRPRVAGKQQCQGSDQRSKQIYLPISPISFFYKEI